LATEFSFSAYKGKERYAASRFRTLSSELALKICGLLERSRKALTVTDLAGRLYAEQYNKEQNRPKFLSYVGHVSREVSRLELARIIETFYKCGCGRRRYVKLSTQPGL